MLLILLLRHAAGHDHGRVEGDPHFGKRQGQLKAIPGLEADGAAVVNVHRQDAAAGELRQLDDAGLELVTRPARAIRGDADVVAFFDLTCQGDEGAHALLGLGAGAALCLDAKGFANVRNDLAIATGAGQNRSWDMGEPVIVQPRDEEHAVVPKGPDHASARGIKGPAPVFNLKGQRRPNAPHEPCDDLACGFDADLGHDRSQPADLPQSARQVHLTFELGGVEGAGLFVGFAAGLFIQLHEMFAELIVAGLTAGLRVGGLDGCAECGTFCGAERDDLCAKGICCDLPPCGALTAATRQAHFFGCHAEIPEALHAVGEPQRRALHRSAGEVGWSGVGGPHAMQHAGAVGQVRGALPIQVGQHQKAVCAWGDGLHGGLQLFMVPAKHVANLLGHDGDVHRADQWQPLIGAIAKSGDLALAIHDGGGRDAVECAAGAKAGGDDAGLDVPGADSAHHVIPTACADDDIRAEAPFFGEIRAQRAMSLAGGAQRRQHLPYPRVDEVDQFVAPFAGADVEDAHAGGIAIFHALHAAEPEVDVVVRQQDGLGFGKVLRLLLLHPHDLGDGVAGQHGIAGEVNDAGLTAEFVGDLRTLCLGGGIAPQLGRADDLVLGIEGDEAVLLTADADAADVFFLGADLLEALFDAGLHRLQPDLGILFQVPRRQAWDEAVVLAAAGQDLAAVEVQNDGLSALGAAVDAEK